MQTEQLPGQVGIKGISMSAFHPLRTLVLGDGGSLTPTESVDF